MSIRVMAAAVATAAGLALAASGPAASAATTSAPAVQLTGTQLLAALLPASDFPAGYKLDKSGVSDSGSHLLTAPAKYNLATISCNSFYNNFGNKGFGETGFASEAFVNGTTSTRILGQTVIQFKVSGVATAFFTGLRAIFHRCPQFAFGQAPGSGVKVTTKVFNAPAVGGHRTFELTETGTVDNLKFGLALVFTVAGQDVFLTGNIGVITTPATSPSPRLTMLRLINRVRAFR
jgi:hypothetical protein